MEVYKFILDLLEQRTPLQYISNHRFYLAIFIVIFFAIAAQITLFLFKKIFWRMARKTKTKIDDQILEASGQPAFRIIIFFGLIVSFISLKLPLIIETFLVRLCTTVIVAYFAVTALRIAYIFIGHFGMKWAKKTKSTVDDDLIPIFNKVMQVLLVIIAFLMIFTVWGIDIKPFLASLGIAGIAVGLALKDTLANIFGGLSLILDRTFKVGDYVELEEGTFGAIHDIGLRATKLRTFNNELVIIPNGKLVNSKIKNHVLPSIDVRVEVDFYIEHGADIDKIKSATLSVISAVKDSLKDPAPSTVLTEIMENGLQFSAKFWVDDIEKRYGAKIEFIEALYKKFDEKGIKLMKREQTVYLKK